MSICVETSEGTRTAEEHLPLGDAELVDALAKLDGLRTTLLTITVLGNELFVGGGCAMYTVTALMDDGRSFALVGDREARGNTAMIVGGQQIAQPVRYVVESDRVLKVARHFSEAGHLDDDELWEEP